MGRRGVVTILGLMLVAGVAVAATPEDASTTCPAANRAVEKVDNGVRCKVTVAEGGDVAALRAHVRECCAKCGPEGTTVAFEEVDGGIVVTRTSADPEVVKSIQAKAEKCAAGKGHCAGHAHGEAGCDHHAKAAPKDATHKGCPHHRGGTS